MTNDDVHCILYSDNFKGRYRAGFTRKFFVVLKTYNKFRLIKKHHLRKINNYFLYHNQLLAFFDDRFFFVENFKQIFD